MIKTTLKVNVERFMEYVETQGNLLHELVKNALETDSGSVFVTSREDVLIVENQKNPVESEKELEEYFLTIFNTGKNKKANFGKGFSTVITEKKTVLSSGNYVVVINKWDDISIDRSDNFVDGTRVVVYLKDDSPFKEIDIERELSGYVTDKDIYLNGSTIETRKLSSLGKLEEIREGMEATLSSSIKGCFFRLIEGSLAPLPEVDIPSMATVVVSDIKLMDSERTRLTWGASNAFGSWFELRCNEDDIVLAQGDVELIEEWMRYVAERCEEISGIKVEYGMKKYTMNDAIYVKRWCNFLNTVKEFGVYKGKMPDIPKLGKSYNMREYGGKFFRPFPECFAGVKIGVLILDGNTQGPGYVQDAIQYKRYVEITNAPFWEALDERMPPILATYVNPLDFVYCDYFVTDSWAQEEGVKVSTTPPDPSLILPKNASEKILKEFSMSATPVGGREADKFKEKYGSGAKTEFKGDVWVQTTYMNVPILMRSSVDMKEVKFTRRIQMEKFRAWRNVVALLVEYLNIDAPIVPIIHINDKHDDKLAFKVSGRGYTYISLSHLGTPLPSTKRRRGLYLLGLALHELCHVYYDGHGPKFTALFDAWYLRLVKMKGFLRDLVGVL